MDEQELLANWQKSYIALNHHAFVGKMFAGTIHNLNSVIQAFSMQTELFAMMFTKLNKQLADIADLTDEPAIHEIITAIQDLISKRQKMISQMSEKIQYSQDILGNTKGLVELNVNRQGYSVRAIVDKCIAFFASNMFFKHKTIVDNQIDEAILADHYGELIVWVFLQFIDNCLDSLQGCDCQKAIITFSAEIKDNMLYLMVADNGPGPSDIDVFAPFVSGHEGKNGLSMYLARQMANANGGDVSYRASSDQTVFVLSLPMV